MAASTVSSYPQVRPLALGLDPLSDASPVRKMGMAVSLLFVFLYISRVTDLALSYLHLPFIIAGLAGAAAVLSGTLGVAIRTRAAKLYAAMTVWICVGALFSIWRGGSIGVITQNWMRSVLIALLVLGLVASFKEVGHLMDAIALGVLFAAILGLRAGVATADGRLEIEGFSRISNPNDLAFAMILGMPLWWRHLTSGSVFRRCAGAIALLPICACFLKTGSRGGLFGLAAMAFVAFLRAPLTGKIKIACVGVLAAAIAFAVLPPYLRARYFTFETADLQDINTEVGERSVGAAAASAMQRKGNLMDSIRITFENPLFSVGAGNFAVAQDRAAKAAGFRRGTWLGTHNTYTELSSECGIPMLILFVTLLVTAMRALGSARRLAARDPRPVAAGIRKAVQTTELVMWGTFVCIFFCHIGYDMTVYMLVSLCLVLARAAQRELAGTPAELIPVPAAPASGPERRGRQSANAGIPLSALQPASGAALRKAARRSR